MKPQYKSVPSMTVDPERTYSVTMKTGKGDIVLELYPEHAPVTVNNFLFLSREGFYDGVSFHRVIPDFMIQGGGIHSGMVPGTCPWPMRDPAPMVASSSSHTGPSLIWTGSTPCSAR